MKKKKITVRKLSELSDVSAVTIIKARTDEGIADCRLSTLAKIGRALGVRTARLYDERYGDLEGAAPGYQTMAEAAEDTSRPYSS